MRDTVNCPTVPRPNPWDAGHSPRRWDAICPTAGTVAGAGLNSWPAPATSHGNGWDTSRPNIVPPPGMNCPTLPSPLVPVGQLAATAWTVHDWHVYRDEREAIAFFDGGLSAPEAERVAWLACIRLWLERHPPLPAALEAWPADTLRLARIAEAVHALAALGVYEPT